MLVCTSIEQKHKLCKTVGFATWTGGQPLEDVMGCSRKWLLLRSFRKQHTPYQWLEGGWGQVLLPTLSQSRTQGIYTPAPLRSAASPPHTHKMNHTISLMDCPLSLSFTRKAWEQTATHPGSFFLLGSLNEKGNPDCARSNPGMLIFHFSFGWFSFLDVVQNQNPAPHLYHFAHKLFRKLLEQVIHV